MNNERLNSWKEIGAYLQRNEATVRRWEKKEGLPVHRHLHEGRSTVYAYPTEIDAWRASRKVVPEPARPRPLWKIPAFAVTMLLCLMMVGNGVRPQAAEAQQRPLAKRALVPKRRISYLTLSPDGQWLGGTDWSNGDLVLTRVSTGETKRMVRGTYDQDPDTWAQSPLLSPDQKQVAYWWYDSSDPKAQGQIRLITNQPGAQARVLINSTGGSDGAYPIAWSPDGKRILATLQKRTEANRLQRDIAWIAVADGSVQTIKTLDPWNSNKGVILRLSPDGHYIAYSGRMQADAPDNGIFVLSAEDGSQNLLVGGGANFDPVWTPDGTRILFSSDRSGSGGLWSVAVRDGKSAGVPILVRPETSVVRFLGITRTGKLFYDYDAGLRQILTADMDPSTGKARGSGVTQGFVGIAPSWSKDGKWLAFKRALGYSSAGYSLILHSMEKGTEWNIAPIPMGDMTPGWDTDASVQPMSNNTLRVNVSSGSPEIRQASIRLPLGALSPDGKLTYVNRGPEMAIFDTTTAEQKGSFKVPGYMVFPSVSPDGKTLAVLDVHNGIHLYRVSVDGSGYKELASDVSEAQPAWSPDGRWILFSQSEKNSTVGRIMRIPAEGGEPELTSISAEGLRHFDLSRDGSKIAYSSGTTVEEVWTLDNVLSAVK